MCQCGIMPCPWSIQCACNDASIRSKGKDVSDKVVMFPSIVEMTLDYAHQPAVDKVSNHPPYNNNLPIDYVLQ